MTLQDATDRAVEVRKLYAAYEQSLYGREWSTQELMLGFFGDVGDLAKLVQGAVGVRAIENLQDKLSHEFADCLWSLLVLAERLEIDLEASFENVMSQLEANLKATINSEAE